MTLCLAGPAWSQDNGQRNVEAPFFGDLEQIRQRRLVRVLVSYNNTNYFIAGGQQRGLEAELMNAFERFINAEEALPDSKIYVVFISKPFAELIPALLAGQGDIIAAGMTVTDEREQQVAFSNAYRKKVSEVLVRSASAPAVASLDELAGRSVHVMKDSSYAIHLAEVNEQRATSGGELIDLVEVDAALASEDVLQMLNADIFDYTFVDRHIAQVWSGVLDDIRVEEDVMINEGGNLAWAVRRDNPKLLERLNAFVAEHKQGTLLGNIFFKRYYRNTQWITNPLEGSAQAKLDEYRDYFVRYGQEYNFDWLKLAALSYQESQFDQSAKSGAGAYGLMQIKPSTAADRNVGITGIEDDAEKNVHAGTKYLAFLRDRYFSDLPPAVQADFAFAAYNAGPARVRRLRARAEEVGLDPDKWFFNVEHIARQEIGRETVDYVANINKYYVAFSSIRRHLMQRAN